ncbi:MAG: hypothetical protein A3B70_06460 [Deltaproteobacteria bacterium RIFCSPHIGHO2_02_FULL_40_11]|nr:MAG: hypothetical protein A3B70_06460 [Deltaproteobacteria bacterium RIFCSPHIGHO2_02_FULL_40_11]
MSNIEVRTIPYGSKAFKDFLHFPWEIYKNDPHWVPPLLLDVKNIFNPKKNPFFEHSSLEILGAYQNNKMVGRLVVGENTASNHYRNENVSFFGFFESADDSNVAKALFEKALEWSKNKGCKTLRGPFNLTFHDDCGLLVEGFDSDPYIMMSYNRPYYDQLIQGASLHQVMDAYAFYGTADDIMTDPLLQISDHVKKELNPVVRQINLKQGFLEDVYVALDMVNESLEGHWATYPMTKKEIAYKANDLKKIVIPELCFFVEVQGKPVGFSLTIPNLNEALKKANGRLFPFGLLKILWHARKIKSLMSFQLGMVKEYQKSGLGAFCYVEIWKRAKALGYVEGEGGRVFANNPRMLQAAKLLGLKPYKTYRWYEKEI